MSSRVLACVDHSKYADYVTDYASWAADKLQKKLELLHLLDCSSESSPDNSNCQKGYDIQSVLMNNFSNRDERQIEMLKEKGKILLENLKNRAERRNLHSVETTQTAGTLIGTLIEKQIDSSLIIIGRKSKSSDKTQIDPVRNIEYVIKSINLPILTVPNEFKEPKKIMVTYDGSQSSKNNILRLIDTRLLLGANVHLLMSGASNPDKQLDWAHNALIAAGLDVSSAFIPGNPQITIAKEIKRLGIDFIVIGAYTGSPLVRLVGGSKTTELLRSLNIPALVMK